MTRAPLHFVHQPSRPRLSAPHGAGHTTVAVKCRPQLPQTPVPRGQQWSHTGHCIIGAFFNVRASCWTPGAISTEAVAVPAAAASLSGLDVVAPPGAAPLGLNAAAASFAVARIASDGAASLALGLDVADTVGAEVGSWGGRAGASPQNGSSFARQAGRAQIERHARFSCWHSAQRMRAFRSRPQPPQNAVAKSFIVAHTGHRTVFGGSTSSAITAAAVGSLAGSRTEDESEDRGWHFLHCGSDPFQLLHTGHFQDPRMIARRSAAVHRLIPCSRHNSAACSGFSPSKNTGTAPVSFPDGRGADPASLPDGRSTEPVCFPEGPTAEPVSFPEGPAADTLSFAGGPAADPPAGTAPTSFTISSDVNGGRVEETPAVPAGDGLRVSHAV